MSYVSRAAPTLPRFDPTTRGRTESRAAKDSALLHYGQVLSLRAPSAGETGRFRMWLEQNHNEQTSVNPASDVGSFLDYQLPQADMHFQDLGLRLADKDSTDLASLSQRRDSWWTERLSCMVLLCSMFMVRSILRVS